VASYLRVPPRSEREVENELGGRAARFCGMHPGPRLFFSPAG
jgi:hypothetical protein